MGIKTEFMWLSEKPEADILDKYGYCCEIPCIFAIYTIDNSNPVHLEGEFLRYECAICSSWLYTSKKSSMSSGVWI